MDKTITFWLQASRDDLETAEIMIKASRYNYAMFMCQQSMESIIKAIIALRADKRPPYIHDLIRLSEHVPFEISKDILEDLKVINPHYIQARYFKQRYDPTIYNKENAKALIALTRRTREWFIEKGSLKNF